MSVCDDGNPCTDDVTDYQNACACTHTPKAAGTACSDASNCTSGDACDGAGHCVGAPVGVVPGDVGNTVYIVKWGNNFAAIRWVPIAHADYYQVVRGQLSGLPVGPGGLDEDCIRPAQYGQEGDDLDIPPVGTGVWYLVRGVNACAGPGPWGFQGDHGAPGAPRITSSCP